jgi:glycosyltransferase involved in cell wall biosynthesis/GT2 family glycosyltransferase
MKQPRITFLTDRMITGHGVDLVVDRIADGLSKKGYFCEVYANHVDETFANRKSYKIYKLPPVGLANFYVLEQRIKKFAKFFNSRDTDLFITQSYPFHSLIPLLKKPSIVVDHGVVLTSGMTFKRRIFFKYLQLTQNLSYFRKAKKVILVSDYLLKQLPPSIQKKSAFIYNGIDHYNESRFTDSQVKDFRQSLKLDDEDVLMLYVGRLNLTNQPYKGLAELVDIFQRANLSNPKIKLLTVGYGSKNDEELLKNQGVLSLANVSEEMMPLVYSASDLYTTCSYWEGFDLPVGEAQYFGKPVVCYNIGAHPEIMVDGRTGYIVETPEQFGARVTELAADKIKRTGMGRYAREFIKKFSWQNSIDNYDIEIRKVLNIAPDEKFLAASQSIIAVSAAAPSATEVSESTPYTTAFNTPAAGLDWSHQSPEPIQAEIPEAAEETKTSVPEEEAAINGLGAISISESGNKHSETEPICLGTDEIIKKIENGLYRKVTALIINYNSSYPTLKECIDSIKDQTYRNIEILVFDNNSTNNAIELLDKEIYINDIKNKGKTGGIILRIIRSEKNLGLGEAINQALKTIDSEYVLISNFDVTYDKIAVEEFVEEITRLDSKYIGLAPKIKLYYQGEYIESVGVYIDNNFYLGYNGIGQIDLDQYNKTEDVFGVSFTSAFLKRDYLCQSVIGPIKKPVDPNYFLYYEDIDFCYRANLLGHRFKSCPSAICFHKYAYSFRDEATAFATKYYYQKLNVLKLAYKMAESHNSKRIINNEIGIQKQNLKDRNLKGVARRILADFRNSRASLKKQRQYIQITRQFSDSEIIKYSWGEKNYFDIVNNEPVYCIQNLLLTYKRLFIITGNRKYEEYIGYLQALEDTRFKIQPESLKKLLNSKLEYEPASIHSFIDKMR